MSIMLKLIEQSFKTTHQLPHTTGQHATKKHQDHQDHHKQTPHDIPLKNSNNYLENAEVKPDVKNSIATNHLATKPILWIVIYNGKLRKINACVKGTLHIINILLLYEHYICVTPCQVHIKGFQLNVQHNNNTQNQGINLLIEIKEPGTD